MKHKLWKTILGVSLLATVLVAPVSAAEFYDMPDDYSTDSIIAAVDNGLVEGYNGAINPDGYLSRSEFSTILVRAFGAVTAADITGYSDVTADAWYADSMAKAVAMEIVQGDGVNLRPADYITRQEVCTVLARAFAMSTDGDLDGYADEDDVDSWAFEAVVAMVEAGYIQGDGEQLNPTDNILRKDMMVILDRMISYYVTDGGEVEDYVDGTILIQSADGLVDGLTITGDLIIADGVDISSLDLSNIVVEGDVVIRSSGDVTLADVSAGGVKITSVAGETTVVIQGNSRIEEVAVAANKATVSVAEGAIVGAVVADGAGTTVTGDGTVTNVVVNANDATIETQGTDVSVADDVTGTTAGGVSVEAGTETSTEETTTTTTTSKTTYYTITFDHNYEGDTDTTTSVKKNRSTTMPNPTRDGYVLMGWSTTASGGVDYAVDATHTVTATKTFYAVWAVEVTTLSDLQNQILTGGNIYISGNVEINASTTIGVDTTLYIADTVTLTVSDGTTLTVDGTLTGASDTSKLVVEDGATVTGLEGVSQGEVYVWDSTESKWVEDVIEVTTEAELSAALEAGRTTIQVTNDITMTANCTVNVDTKLIVTSGKTLTIGDVSAGAVLTIVTDRTLTVDGNLTVFGYGNRGVLDIQGTLDNTSATITNNGGWIYVYDETGLNTALDIGGDVFVKTAFTTTGDLEVDEGSMAVDGITLTIGSGKTLTVNDDCIVSYRDSGTLEGSSETSKLVVSSDAIVYVDDQTPLTAGKTYYWDSNIGWMEATVVTNQEELADALAAHKPIIQVTDDIIITDDYTVSVDTTLIVDEGKTLTIGYVDNNIWGVLTIDQSATLTFQGDLINEGDLYIQGDMTLDGTYDSSDYGYTYVYNESGLKVALSDNCAFGVIVSDDIVVTESHTIGADAYLEFDPGCTLTTTGGGSITNSGTIIVRDSAELGWALDIGGTVYVYSDITTEADLVVESGSELYLYYNLTVGANTTLTVDGSVSHSGGYSALKGVDATSKLVVGDDATVYVDYETPLTTGTYVWYNDAWTVAVTTDAGLKTELDANTTTIYVADSFDITGSYTVYSTTTLVIPMGMTLTVGEGNTLDVRGTLTMEGTLTVENGGHLDVNGTLIVASGATLSVENGGHLDVYGTLEGTDATSRLVIAAYADVSGVTGVSAGNTYVWDAIETKWVEESFE